MPPPREGTPTLHTVAKGGGRGLNWALLCSPLLGRGQFSVDLLFGLTDLDDPLGSTVPGISDLLLDLPYGTVVQWRETPCTICSEFRQTPRQRTFDRHTVVFVRHFTQIEVERRHSFANYKKLTIP